MILILNSYMYTKDLIVKIINRAKTSISFLISSWISMALWKIITNDHPKQKIYS